MWLNKAQFPHEIITADPSVRAGGKTTYKWRYCFQHHKWIKENLVWNWITTCFCDWGFSTVSWAGWADWIDIGYVNIHFFLPPGTLAIRSITGNCKRRASLRTRKLLYLQPYPSSLPHIAWEKVYVQQAAVRKTSTVSSVGKNVFPRFCFWICSNHEWQKEKQMSIFPRIKLGLFQTSKLCACSRGLLKLSAKRKGKCFTYLRRLHFNPEDFWGWDFNSSETSNVQTNP